MHLLREEEFLEKRRNRIREVRDKLPEYKTYILNNQKLIK